MALNTGINRQFCPVVLRSGIETDTYFFYIFFIKNRNRNNRKGSKPRFKLVSIRYDNALTTSI